MVPPTLRLIIPVVDKLSFMICVRRCMYVCMCTWYTVCACYMHAWRTRVCACVRAYACIATVYKHTHEHVTYVGWLICLESLMSTPPLMYVQSKHTPSHSLYLQFPSLR